MAVGSRSERYRRSHATSARGGVDESSSGSIFHRDADGLVDGEVVCVASSDATPGEELAEFDDVGRVDALVAKLSGSGRRLGERGGSGLDGHERVAHEVGSDLAAGRASNRVASAEAAAVRAAVMCVPSIAARALPSSAS